MTPTAARHDPDWEPDAEGIRRMAAGILAGLSSDAAQPQTVVDRRDASVTRCTCGAWRMRGRACDTCGRRPWLGAS